ncbi:unnamed protein product [Moneuplotes crassus]|uniref:Uncharacterized protein n=1 Tax=Euplotes crassus TaxID=5936 RepID=A0AAD1Y358_EUPCR|nr:unnamed protein product [Moneuplotes crassus]
MEKRGIQSKIAEIITGAEIGANQFKGYRDSGRFPKTDAFSRQTMELKKLTCTTHPSRFSSKKVSQERSPLLRSTKENFLNGCNINKLFNSVKKINYQFAESDSKKISILGSRSLKASIWSPPLDETEEMQTGFLRIISDDLPQKTPHQMQKFNAQQEERKRNIERRFRNSDLRGYKFMKKDEDFKTPQSGKNKRKTSSNLLRLSYLYKKLNIMNVSDKKSKRNISNQLNTEIKDPRKADFGFGFNGVKHEYSTKSDTSTEIKLKFNQVWGEESKIEKPPSQSSKTTKNIKNVKNLIKSHPKNPKNPQKPKTKSNYIGYLQKVLPVYKLKCPLYFNSNPKISAQSRYSASKGRKKEPKQQKKEISYCSSRENLKGNYVFSKEPSRQKEANQKLNGARMRHTRNNAEAYTSIQKREICYFEQSRQSGVTGDKRKSKKFKTLNTARCDPSKFPLREESFSFMSKEKEKLESINHQRVKKSEYKGKQRKNAQPSWSYHSLKNSGFQDSISKALTKESQKDFSHKNKISNCRQGNLSFGGKRNYKPNGLQADHSLRITYIPRSTINSNSSAPITHPKTSHK